MVFVNFRIGLGALGLRYKYKGAFTIKTNF